MRLTLPRPQTTLRSDRSASLDSFILVQSLQKDPEFRFSFGVTSAERRLQGEHTISVRLYSFFHLPCRVLYADVSKNCHEWFLGMALRV